MQDAYNVERFASDLTGLLRQAGTTPECVLQAGSLLQRLAREGGDLSQAGDPRTSNSGLPSRLLHSDPDGLFVLTFVQFPPHAVTPVHSHESWGAMCILDGGERYTSWRVDERTAAGNDPDLTVIFDHHMEPGDLGYWFNDPYNIHRQWPGDKGCRELVLFGGQGVRLAEFSADRLR